MTEERTSERGTAARRSPARDLLLPRAMRPLSHFVPSLALAGALALPGCYLSDGRGSGPRDAGPAPAVDAWLGLADAAPVLDAGPAPLPDAGLRCEPVRADFACLESFVVPAGRPSVLPLSFDVCACCAQTECGVSVDTAGRTVRVTTTLCPDPCDCATCNTPLAQCELPALAAGTWTLEVNGGAAMTLPVVRDEPGLIPPPPACVDFAAADGCTAAEGVLRATQPQRATRACVRPTVDSSQRYELDLYDECGGCDRESTCTVEVTERLTDDLPAGSDVRVRARRYAGACDGACPEICMPHTRTCAIPPFDASGLTRVIVEGGPSFTFTAGTFDVVCSDEG